MTTACRLGAGTCPLPVKCNPEDGCKSIAECGPELHDFLKRDAMRSLRSIITMIDDGKPIEHVRIELQALLMRAARTV